MLGFYSLEEYLLHLSYYYLVTSQDVEKTVKLTHYNISMEIPNRYLETVASSAFHSW